MPKNSLKSIQLAVDTSPGAEVATRYAAFLGERLGLPLHALHVMDSRVTSLPGWSGVGVAESAAPTPEFGSGVLEVLRTRGEEVLGEVRRTVSAEVHTELLAGVPATEILGAARAHDLIVLGKQGEVAGRAVPALGSTAERVVRRAEGAVLVTPTRFREPRRVLLGFDGSRRATEALGYAAEVARRLKLPVLAVSVHESRTVAEAQLETVRDHVDAATDGLELELTLEHGDPAEAILAAATEDDLLAIGAFGEGRLHEFFRGSTTEAVLLGADNPVLLHA